jgi:hypothetical protein
MKSILVSSRRVLALTLIASAFAFVPAAAKADSTDPEPIKMPTAMDASLVFSLALAAYGL